ncbi:coil containing protein [Vibrio phage 1.190.O._10N.286.51.F12]|nr:coil containing protein [Vibrio phage 1.190.O._10N.286.51.F12]
MKLSISLGERTVDIGSATKLDGFQVTTASESRTGDRYIFIRDMTKTIYARIFTSALNSLAMTESQQNSIKTSAFDKFTPYSEGFIKHIVKAAACKQSVKVWAVDLSTGEKRFTDTKPDNQKEEQALELDFSKFEEARMVASIVNMMFSALDGAAAGLKATKTLFMKIEKLADHLADKKIKAEVEAQIKAFDTAWREGSVAFTSSGSDAKFFEFDTTPAKDGMSFCFGLLSTITGYPAEFFDGLQSGTMSDTGASTEKAIYRANETYAMSVLIPFISEVFGEKLKMKPLLINLDQLAGMIAFVETTQALDLEEKQLVLSNFGLQGNGLKEMANKPEPEPTPNANESDQEQENQEAE